MRKKVLFDYAERYTERGDYYYRKIAEALRVIYMEAEADNVKLREVSHAVTLTAQMLEVEGILQRDVQKTWNRGQLPLTLGEGITPPSSPMGHSSWRPPANGAKPKT
jgi:hypothetical protein